MGFLKKILPIVAGVAGNTFLPGSGGAFSGLASGLFGGHANKQSTQDMIAAEQAQWAAALRANRPNQTSASGATSQWVQDPTTGQWSQTQKFGPEEQARRDLFNQMAQGRMQKAANVDLSMYDKPIDYQAFQLKHSPMSMGGNFLGG